MNTKNTLKFQGQHFLAEVQSKMGRQGLLTKIKKISIKRTVKKWKARNDFNLASAEWYTLPSDASDEMGDSHSFYGFNFENNEMFYLRINLRGGECDNEVWLIYRDKAGRIFVQEHTRFAKGNEVPIVIKTIETGKLVSFNYSGFVYPAIERANGYEADTTAKPVPFILDGEFKGVSDAVEFLQNVSSETMANAFCRESKINLMAFKHIRQTSYSQMGRAKGYITIGGRSFRFTDCNVVRRRAFGICEWDSCDRFINMDSMLENGDVVQTHHIRYPILDELKSGFAVLRSKRVSVTDSTSMDRLPVTGGVPKSFSMNNRYEGTAQHSIYYKTDFSVPYQLQGGFAVSYGFGMFTVDGSGGKGMVEFGFSSDKSKWKRE